MSNSWGKYSDKELFEMMKVKDSLAEKAFSEFYHRYSDKIFNYCRRILVSYQDTKDVFQETFVKFYQNIETFEDSGSVGGLLFKIARNQALYYTRQHKNFSELKEDMYSESYSEHENADTMEMINKALELIPHNQKEAFILRHYQGFSYEEIAQITMSDAGTIRNRVKRAITHLQKILKPIFEDNDEKDISKKSKKSFKFINRNKPELK